MIWAIVFTYLSIFWKKKFLIDVIPGQQNSPQPQLLIQPHMPMASAQAEVQGMPVGSPGGQIQLPGSQ